MQIIAYFDKIRIKHSEVDLIKLVLTNIYPDKEKQKEHDSKIMEWVCEEEDSCITVLELSNILKEENNLQAEEIFEELLNFVKNKKNEIVLIDTSRDHYWRDLFEGSVFGLKIVHNPYPDDLFS